MSLSIDKLDGVSRTVNSKDTLGKRLVWLDGARTIALVCMIVFHFARDLELFGILPAGTTLTGGWAVFARLIAGSFLFFAGLSLVLAHRNSFRLKAWAKRLVMILGAAGLISVATFIAFPERFIYFGILHAIGFASIVGLTFLRVPFWVTGLSAAAVLIFGFAPNIPLFQSPWLAWTGLSETVRPSLDFIPVFPWLAAFLLGMAVAQCLPDTKHGTPTGPSNQINILTWPGRHSLAIYLVHQPILIGLIWLAIAFRP